MSMYKELNKGDLT